ncbi:MAG: hypothetical protein IVW57_06415 [Ktedonobacterales bacterium]|nr:hypothetical protein [Ktedonobacterales bacterium]
MTTPPKRAKPRESEHEARSAKSEHEARSAKSDATETLAPRARETRPLAAISAHLGDTTSSQETPVSGPAPADSTPHAPDISADAEATAIREVTRAASLPGKDAVDQASASGSQPAMPPTAMEATAPMEDLPNDFPEEIPDESDGWAAADQPTIVLSPHAFKRKQTTSPETSEPRSWPPNTTRPNTLGDVTPPISLRGQEATSARPSGLNGPRLAAPDGRRALTSPPEGVARAALSNPRMHRFQELRRQRVTHEQGERAPDEGRPVTEVMRQWWGDLRPGLERALSYQREARASGMHPIPAHEPTAFSRLGDAFGYMATSVRDLAERATHAAGPRLKHLHTRAERAAQAFIQKFEGSEVRQQGPLLGPGRIAVFFRPAVTVGQAQRLLAATQARPMRIIPRKHGFLAWVKPGTEAEVSERLKMHPYVDDVAYLDYDVYGDPVDPNEMPQQP